MEEQALALRWPCGCITYADARPSEMTVRQKRIIADYIAEGAEVVRGSADELRALPNFLVTCTHRDEEGVLA